MTTPEYLVVYDINGHPISAFFSGEYSNALVVDLGLPLDGAGKPPEKASWNGWSKEHGWHDIIPSETITTTIARLSKNPDFTLQYYLNDGNDVYYKPAKAPKWIELPQFSGKSLEEITGTFFSDPEKALQASSEAIGDSKISGPDGPALLTLIAKTYRNAPEDNN